MGCIYGIKINEESNTAYIKEFSYSEIKQAYEECLCVCGVQSNAWTFGDLLNEQLAGNKTYIKYMGMAE